MKKLWFSLITMGIFFAFLNRKPEVVYNVLLNDLQKSISLILSLIPVMAFWSGLMRIAEKSGIMDKFTVLLKPLISLLFKDIEDNNKAMNAVIMTLAANLFGIGNSATALGIQAMKEMQKINKNKKIPTKSMCMLIIINVSSIQLIPLSVIKLRADAGAPNPTDVLLPTLIATAFSTIVAIVSAKYYERKEI